ncbi:MAG: AMP-binding protein [Pseudomonadales bacterium]|jgi:fatty-acyl-CoA synthase|nr:AMP-binding protein [Pseudomonadales bacterium]
MTRSPSYAQGPTTPPVKDLTIGAALEEAAAEAPARLAMVDAAADPAQRRQWTYAEMLAESRRVARALAHRFEPGERVAIWAPNCPEWVLAEFGAAMAGVILVTVNPAYRPDELAYVLEQSRSAGILVWPEFRGNRMLAAVEDVRSRCPELREVVRLDAWEAFLASAPEDQALPAVAPGDPVMIQYTSGTTGFPKGALLHHRGLVNNGAHTADRLGVRDGDVWLTMMPLFHTGGCVICVLGALARRATAIVMQAFEPGLALELIEQYRVNALLGVPTMLIGMIEHPEFASRDLASLERITSGGSTVPAALVRRFEDALGAPFTIVFGQTECSPVASMTRPDDSQEDKANTLGGPMPNVEIKVVDPQSGEVVPCGTLGEYCTRGYHVMLGYFENPDATAAAIDADGWLHTGDLCTMDERGYCAVEGRLKDMIIRGGENIYPRELEELLFRHPSVGEVAVVGLPDERLGEIVAAFLRPAPGQTPVRDELFAYLREKLAPHKTPKHWFLVDAFPLTGSGKIQKFVLRQQWSEGRFEEL